MKSAPLAVTHKVKIIDYDIPVYGTKAVPLFDATYIAWMFNIKCHSSVTRVFSSAECFVIIVADDGTAHRLTVLTIAGLERFVKTRKSSDLTTAILQWIETTNSDRVVEQQLSELDNANSTIQHLQNELSRLQQRDIANEHKDIEIARLNEALLKSDEQNQQLNHLIDQLQLSQCENDTANVQLRTELADVIARSRSFRSAIVKAKSTHNGIVAALRDHDPI